jgi:ABC-type transport system involved in cytochrome c biogenesis permease subunit
MHKLFLLFFLITAPVLYEGRYRPLETVPKGEHYTLLEVENYDEIAGTFYLQAQGKGLKYPTRGQLRAELVLHFFPFKWLIIASYLVAAALFSFWKTRIGWLILAVGFLLHTTALALHCFVLSRPPVSNMAETLLYVPWIAILIGFLFCKRGGTTLIAAPLAAITLLLFLPTHPSLENVQAVLDSQYWLIVHVLMVVGSYGVFCLSGVCGHIYLIKNTPSDSLEKTLIQTLYLGTSLLICGTILGGVWAAESWGRFWDWDPKEAWAFISSGIYLLWIHAYRFKKIGGRGLAVGSIVGLLAITFTWYGVNYILGSGLHSYGFGHGGEWLYYLYLAAEIVFLSAIFLKKIYKNSED